MTPDADQLCLAERVEVKHEADGRGRVLIAVELGDVHSEDCELIMMWRVTLWRAWPAIAWDAEVGAALHRALRRVRALRIARPQRRQPPLIFGATRGRSGGPLEQAFGRLPQQMLKLAARAACCRPRA